MKIKFFALVLTAVLMCFCLMACNNSENSGKTSDTENKSDKIDNVIVPDNVYDQLLLDTHDYIKDFDSDAEVKEGRAGIFEVLSILEDKNSGLESIGYATEDLNKDGADELIIAKVNDGDATSPAGTAVLALYTFADDEVKLVFEGTSQSRYYILQDNSVFNEVSGGADFAFGNYLLKEQSSELQTIGYYFAVPQSSDNEMLSFYYNEIGVQDVNNSSTFDGDAELFSQVQKDYSNGIKEISLMTFEGFELIGSY